MTTLLIDCTGTFSGNPKCINFGYIPNLNLYFFRIDFTGAMFFFTPNLVMCHRIDISAINYKMETMEYIISKLRNEYDFISQLIDYAGTIVKKFGKYRVKIIKKLDSDIVNSIRLYTYPINILAVRTCMENGSQASKEILDRLYFACILLRHILPKELVYMIILEVLELDIIDLEYLSNEALITCSEILEVCPKYIQ